MGAFGAFAQSPAFFRSVSLLEERAMCAATPRFRTPGVIAAELERPLHSVLYVLRTRPHIRPAARAGRLRLYDREALDLVRVELAAIAARRGATKGVSCA